MKVLLLPADKSGCGYYRMTEPARAVQEAGYDVDVEVDYGLDIDGERRDGVTTIHSVDSRGADLVVFQRPSGYTVLAAMRLLKAQGVAVVVEVDDLMHGVSNAHAGHKAIREEGAANRIFACAQEADLVTVSSWALLGEYARHGRGRMIPNAIPRRIAELTPAYERKPDVITIGWTGSVYTHPHDLQMVGTGLRTALDRTEGASRFAILGQAAGARERLTLAEDPPQFPWMESVDSYLSTIGDLFDVGIAPLRVDRFNKSKSYLKPLEYAARGVYSVRSVIDEYDTLGLGYRAKSPKDWAQGLTRAVTDPDARRAQAQMAHDTVMLKHLTEHTAERWVSAWRQALMNRAKAG